MTSPAAAGLGPDGPASHLPGRHSSDSGSFKLIKNLLVTAHWDGRSPQRRNRSFVPRKRSGGEHRFYYPKRKAPPKSAFGVSFLRCDVTFSTPHHITHRKPKPPSIRKNRACPYVSLGSPWKASRQLTGQARRSDLPPTPPKIKNSRSADHSVRSADQLWRRQRLGSGRIGKI